jgi:hypothetical protein
VERRIKTEQANDFIFKNHLNTAAPDVATLMREYVYNQHMVGYKRFLKEPLVEALPEWLQFQLARYQHRRFLVANDFFNKNDEHGAKALSREQAGWAGEQFFMRLVLTMRWRMCLRNDLLLHCDYPCKEVFFVPEALEMHLLDEEQDLEQLNTDTYGKHKVKKIFHQFTAFGLDKQISVVAPKDTDLRWVTETDCKMLSNNFPDQYDCLQRYVTACVADERCLHNETPSLEPAIEAELERMKRADLGYRDENTGDDAGDI